MAIRIVEYSEPLAGPPKWPPPSDWPPTLIAGSVALRRLIEEMDRHCNRTIAGRSFLIGGGRGAGKTTLAKAAIEQVAIMQQRRADERKLLPHLPLYVPLHGATLLREYDVLGEQSPLKDVDPNLKRMFISLRAITIALHHAFMTHLGWAFEARADGDPKLRELAAQLRINLDRGVELRGLRWFWKKARLLENGALRKGELTRPEDYYYTDQGLLDLVATWSVIDAFQRAAANVVDDKESSRSDAKVKMEEEQQKTDSQKQLVNSITGVLAGGAAGVGVGVNNPLMGALTFIATATVSTLALNLVSQRSFSQEQSKERNITWDSSIKSLEIILPHVINRIRDAGRTPIFVIDELDKVEDLDVKLESLMSNLKNIIADDAFFCFLVGRDYFEEVQSIAKNTPQSKEYSFFRERHFAVIHPKDWHEYLAARLEVEAADATESAKSYLDRLALQYVLLARGKMYALDVARAIEALPTRGDNGTIDIATGQIAGLPEYKNQILMQAIVEYLLADPKISVRIERDPGFQQMVYDALYYLLREWERNSAPEIDRDAVMKYLLKLRRAEQPARERPGPIPPVSGAV